MSILCKLFALMLKNNNQHRLLCSHTVRLKGHYLFFVLVVVFSEEHLTKFPACQIRMTIDKRMITLVYGPVRLFIYLCI